ncbi:hypothetical protein CC79DRAFT_1363023 [Sarocladium strictum]
MENKAPELDVPLRHPDAISTEPVRILVQTVTQLVPGNDYAQRVQYMQNLICQHHWNRDFDRNQDRWNVYGHHFSYENRNCYFLIDHGSRESPKDPQVLWYKWTGEALILMQQTLPADVQRVLKDYPFSNQPIQRPRSEMPRLFSATEHRQIIRTKLRCDMAIIEEDIRFLKAQPEAAEWLQSHIEPQLWMKIQALLEQHKDTC